MSESDRQALHQKLESLCDDLEVRRIEADDIVELLSDGEDPAWVAEQALEEEGEGRQQLQKVLTELAPLVYTAPEPDEEEDEEPAEATAGEQVPPEEVAEDPADLQAQLAQAQAELAPPAVVGPLDPGDDRNPQLLPGGPRAAVEDVLLQQGEERL